MYYGGEFTAEGVRDWLKQLQVKTLYIEPGSPWENGYNESYMDLARAQVALLGNLQNSVAVVYPAYLYGRRIDALAMMDFRALHAADRSSGLGGHDSNAELRNAGPTGSPSSSSRVPTQPG